MLRNHPTCIFRYTYQTISRYYARVVWSLHFTFHREIKKKKQLRLWVIVISTGRYTGTVSSFQNATLTEIIARSLWRRLSRFKHDDREDNFVFINFIFLDRFRLRFNWIERNEQYCIAIETITAVKSEKYGDAGTCSVWMFAWLRVASGVWASLVAYLRAHTRKCR